MRTLVVIVGILIAAVGASQVAAASLWLDLTRSLVYWPVFSKFAILPIAVGVVLAYSGMYYIVGLRVLIMIVGTWSLLAGLLLLAFPGLVTDLIQSLILSRPQWFQLAALRAAGLLRLLVGVSLVYAALAPADDR